MPTPVLICDDSSLARKLMARALPETWDVELSFARNGVEAISAIREGKGEIMFLDLNMPEMDGYEVLEQVRAEDLQSMVVVVSGDVQPEAYQRVKQLGAIDFVKKPVNAVEIDDVLRKFGIELEGVAHKNAPEMDVDIRDVYREITNVAMGRAGDLLARLLGAFVKLPIPNVNMIEPSELRMALGAVSDNEQVSAVCQGFIGAGIAGEALLIFSESSFPDIASLMRHEGEIDSEIELELLMDIGNILIGACLGGIADQLDISFSQGQPIVLGRHEPVEKLLERNSAGWNTTLAIEIGYKIEGHQVKCDLLLLFSEDSLDTLQEMVAFLTE